jgi:hypothetical protein
MTYVQQPQQQQPQRRRKSRVGVIVLVVTVALVAGCGILAYAVTSAGVDATQQVDAAISSAAVAVGSGQVGSAPTANDPDQIGEGRHEVGKDVRPGTYKATVPADSIGCYWARLKSLDGGADSIITNGVGQPGSKLTVEIKTTDKGFETQGCGTWSRG